MYILQETYINATFIKLEIPFVILFSKNAIAMRTDQLVLLVMIMEYAIVNLTSSIPNVIHVLLVVLDFLCVINVSDY